MTEPHDPARPDDGGDGLPPEIAALFRNLTGGDLDPQAAEMLKGMGLGSVDPKMLEMVMGQVQAMFSAPDTGTAVNATVAMDTAHQVLTAAGGAAISEADSRAVADAVSVADLWLDPVTEIRGSAPRGVAWTPAEWVAATMPLWCDLAEPVAAGVSGAVSTALTAQLEALGDGELTAEAFPPGMLPPGADPKQLFGQLGPMLQRLNGSMFSLQLGQGVGALGSDVLTGNEVSLPLVAHPQVALLPASIATFADGLATDLAQVRLYLAVREVARARLFGGVPWLASQVTAAVQDYARDITIDTEAIEEGVRSIDPSDPEAVASALQGRLFAPTPSAAQKAALARLETLLALIEGWVDVVTDRATSHQLPQSAALGEAVRRRRASGGPAEKTFAALVGLELRPRRLRDAANLFAALESAGGPAARDGAWEHPDVAPTAADLDDPLGYVERIGTNGTDDLDAELEALLRGDGSPEA